MPAFRRLLFKLLLSSCALLAPLALPIAATAQSSETDAALDRIVENWIADNSRFAARRPRT